MLESFFPSTEKKKNKMANMWKCNTCGYFHVGIDPPEECPGCGETNDGFQRIREKPKKASNEEKQQEKAIEAEESSDLTDEDLEANE